MDEIPQGIAEAANAGLVARAAERDGDALLGDARPAETGAQCLNCGTALVGSHCHACGQRGEVHRTLRQFGHDLLHGVLHFEGKLWRTVPALVWRPGQLTREYIDGKRARYISPIAFFLFVVLVTYVGFSALAPELPEDFAAPPGTIAEVREQQATLQADIAEVESQMAQTAFEPERAAMRAELDVLRSRLNTLHGIEASLTNEGATADEGESEADDTDAAGEASQPQDLLDSDELPEELKGIADNPQLAAYKLQTNAYKFAWALIPLSAPFVWLLLFWKRRFRMYDHVVFVTYSIGFMIALTGLSFLVGAFVSQAAGGLMLLYAPWHLYRQLRGTYGLTRFGALWRLFVLSAFIWLVIGLFIVLLGYSVGS